MISDQELAGLVSKTQSEITAAFDRGELKEPLSGYEDDYEVFLDAFHPHLIMRLLYQVNDGKLEFSPPLLGWVNLL